MASRSSPRVSVPCSSFGSAVAVPFWTAVVPFWVAVTGASTTATASGAAPF
jgi:hypothetical protein